MQRYNLSISTDFVGKLEDREMYKAAILHPASMTIDEIADHLAVRGHAICCAELKTNNAGVCRRQIANFVGAQLFGVDVDFGAPFEELKMNAFLRQYAAFAYTTASHTDDQPRYRIIFALQRPETEPERYKRLVSIIADKFAGDANARDAVRIWYGSPNAQLITFGQTMAVDDVTRFLEEHQDEQEQQVRLGPLARRKFTHTDLHGLLKAMPPHTDHLEYKRFINGIFHEFGPDEEVFDMLQKWSPSKVPYSRWFQHRMTNVKLGTSIYLAQRYGEYKPPSDYLRDDPKTAAESYDHVESYLLSVAQFRRNIIKADVEYTEDTGAEKEWQKIDDHFVNSQVRAMTKLKIKTHKDRVWDVLRSDFCSDYDALVEYFAALPEIEDDEGDYIEALADMIPPVDDTIETAAEQRATNIMILTRWLIAAYRCAIFKQPNHIMLVFQGAQGTGKTRLLRHLCPYDLRKGYYYEGEFTKDKDTLKRIYTSFLAVDDELGGMNKSSLEGLKSMITMDRDELRLPYGRSETMFERIVSFAGTVNDRNFLSDHTGNRRFAPIPVGGLIWFNDPDEGKLELDEFPVDRLWAQVRHMAMQSVEINGRTKFLHRSYFNDADMKLLARRQDDFMVDSYTDELVRQYVVATDEEGLPINATELLFAVMDRLPEGQKQKVDGRLQYQFQRSLKRAGMLNKRKKVGGVSKRGYFARVKGASDFVSTPAPESEGLF